MFKHGQELPCTGFDLHSHALAWDLISSLFVGSPDHCKSYHYKGERFPQSVICACQKLFWKAHHALDQVKVARYRSLHKNCLCRGIPQADRAEYRLLLKTFMSGLSWIYIPVYLLPPLWNTKNYCINKKLQLQ